MTHAISADDRRFRDELETGGLPPDQFDHRAHVRLAYIYLAEHDDAAAVARVRGTLQQFIRRQGLDAAKYHETMTRAWLLAVRHFMRRTPPCGSSDAFIAANSVLLDRGIILSHYTRETLFSADARRQFVEPDREPIP